MSVSILEELPDCQSEPALDYGVVEALHEGQVQSLAPVEMTSFKGTLTQFLHLWQKRRGGSGVGAMLLGFRLTPTTVVADTYRVRQ